MIYVGTVLSDDRIFVIGRDTPEVVDIDQIVRRTLIAGVVPVFFTLIGLGALSSRRMRQRLRKAEHILATIKDGNLANRLPVTATPDELDTLAISVNEMLDELERAVGELQNVGNHIAHDLRTPLARVREILLQHLDIHLIPENRRSKIDLAITIVDQMLASTSAMLRVARIEAGRSRANFKPVDLKTILFELYDFYEPLAVSRNLSISLSANRQTVVNGDRDLILEAISNLIDNAIKFTPCGGVIELKLIEKAPYTVVSVTDTGPGIPVELRSRIFDRFYRARGNAEIPGTGLGLSMVASIARLHGWDIAVNGGPPGCTIEIAFDRRPQGTPL